jgi:hypothetical protein
MSEPTTLLDLELLAEPARSRFIMYGGDEGWGCSTSVFFRAVRARRLIFNSICGVKQT